jgi:outer membrane protein assembly factor BamB
MLFGGYAYAETKSGVVYAVNRANGSLLWQMNLHPLIPGVGGVGTPTSDQTVPIVIFSSGLVAAGCNLVAFDLAGNIKYTIPSTREQRGYVAFIPGIGFTPLDKTIAAFDSGSGTMLWSHATADAFYASPAIVPSGLYDVDLSGNVYAFGMRGTAPSSAVRRPLRIVPHPDQPYRTDGMSLLLY